jgi:hypothetical protein
MLRPIQGTQRLPRELYFKVTGTGTAAINEGLYDATLVDNGTGDYTLTWAVPFARSPVVVVSTMTADSVMVVTAASATAATIKGFDATDGTTAKDVVFNAIVMGWDTADQY